MLCSYTTPRYQVSVKKTIGPLVFLCCLFFCVRGSRKFHFMLVHIISSPEPLGSQGELTVYLSSRSTSVRRSPSNIFKDLLLRNHFGTQIFLLKT